MIRKPILFIDFDGTLCYDRFWKSLKPDLQSKVQECLFTTNKTIVRDWMKGLYTSEDVNKLLSEKLSIEYESLWNTFVDDCSSMAIDTSVLDKISSLREKYITVLMTDNMDCFDRFTVPSLGLSNYFDLIVNSSNEGVSKNENEGKLFRDIATRMSLGDMNESILIDNSEKTCEIFSKMGGESLFVTDGMRLSHWLDNLDLRRV